MEGKTDRCGQNNIPLPSAGDKNKENVLLKKTPKNCTLSTISSSGSPWSIAVETKVGQ